LYDPLGTDPLEEEDYLRYKLNPMTKQQCVYHRTTIDMTKGERKLIANIQRVSSQQLLSNSICQKMIQHCTIKDETQVILILSVLLDIPTYPKFTLKSPYKLKHQSNPQGQKITEGVVMPLSLMLDKFNQVMVIQLFALSFFSNMF